MRICFFDFDGTLTSKDTLFEFARFARGRWRLCAALFASLPAIVGWKLGFMTNSAAKQVLFSHLFKGVPYDVFQQKGKEFAAEIPKFLRQDTVATLRRHIAQGHTPVIVSASMAEWIEPWADKNGVAMVIATQPEVDAAGRLTGRFATPNCVGPEKVRRIKEAFPTIDDCETWAYGDSPSDSSMLQIATHPQRV